MTMIKRLPLLGTLVAIASLAGVSSTAQAQWGAQPAQVTEVLTLNSEVQLSLVGTPGAESINVVLQRRAAGSVLSQCTEFGWQVDGATVSMPVSYASEAFAGGVAETLTSRAGTNNTAMIGNARSITLTVCGASFSMTPAQLGQFASFSRQIGGNADRAPQQPAGPQEPAPAQAAVTAQADVAAEAVFVAPEPAPVAAPTQAPAPTPTPAPVAQQQAPRHYTPPVQPTEDESVTASRSGMIFGAALMGVGLAAVPWWISRRRVLNETCPCLDQQRISRSRWAAVGISLGGLALGGLVFALGVKQRLRARREGLTTLDLEIRGDGLSLSGSF